MRLVAEVSDAHTNWNVACGPWKSIIGWRKRPLFARAGIPEYWLVNLVDNTIEVHRRPAGDAYTQTFTRYKRDSISVAAFASVELQVEELIR